MIIGDPSNFAIESRISIAYERLSFLALGFFVLHIGGRCYGVRTPDATLIACAFEEVQRRIEHRGKHIAPFSSEPDSGKIAAAFRDAIYAPDPEPLFFGVPLSDFSSLIYSNNLRWDHGDEAFDDGSFILHFDVGNRVRLIAVHSLEDKYRHNPETLRDIWLDAEVFYNTLQQWSDEFVEERNFMPKVSESEEDSEEHLRQISLLAKSIVE